MALASAPATKVKAALHGLLAADADLVAALAEYRGQPGIFLGRLVPPDADKPFLHLRAITEAADDALVERGLVMACDVAAFAADSGSPDTLEAIANRVRVLLHGQRLELPGDLGRVLSVQAGQTLDAPEEPDGVDGRIVSLTIRYRE